MALGKPNLKNSQVFLTLSKTEAKRNKASWKNNSLRKVAGVDSVGIGGDFNGVETPPVDISDVSHYPEVFEALIEDGEVEWTDEDLGKLASGNIIRVFKVNRNSLR